MLMFEFIPNTVLLHTAALIGAWGLFLSIFSSLFWFVNPLAAMPIFLSLTDRFTEKDRVHTANKAAIYMFCVFFTFMLIGTFILSFFGISLAGIRIAGGLIIMRAAYGMLNPDR